AGRLAEISHHLSRDADVADRRIGRLVRRRWVFAGRRRLFGRRRVVGWRRRLGTVVMELSAQDRARVSAAIAAAEARTSGEIVCVLAQRSADATALPILVAAIAALALPWLLV